MNGEVALLAEEHGLVSQLVTVLLGRILRSPAFMAPTVHRWLKSYPQRSGMHVETFLEKLLGAILKDRLRFEVILQGGGRAPIVSVFYLFSSSSPHVNMPMYSSDMEETERDMLTRLVPFFASQWRGTGISYTIRCVSFTYMDAVRHATDRMAVARRIVYAVLEQAMVVPEAPQLAIRWLTVAALNVGPEASAVVNLLLRDTDSLWEEMAREHASHFRRWCTNNHPDNAQNIWIR